VQERLRSGWLNGIKHQQVGHGGSSRLPARRAVVDDVLMTARCVLDMELALKVTEAGRMALSVAVAGTAGLESEQLSFRGTGSEAGTPTAELVEFPHGTRLHVVDLTEGELTVHYRAERACRDTEAEAVSPADVIRYTRPSRYCPSDRIGAVAAAEFGHLSDVRGKIEAIVRFIGDRILYVSGSSRVTDDATNTLLGGEGVCRDFAHLGVTFCRALDIPARFVSVYAPGLFPMDFHAVFEAAIDGRWYVFDATHLAPRQSMTRIATGRDAADTAFLTTLGCRLDLTSTTVTATIDPHLPQDDGAELVTLA
jgi:transglutaminase-like putative cysteine protease